MSASAKKPRRKKNERRQKIRHGDLKLKETANDPGEDYAYALGILPGGTGPAPPTDTGIKNDPRSKREKEDCYMEKKIIISRIMSQTEFRLFRDGCSLRPLSSRYIGAYNDAKMFPELKDGAFFFVPGDAREFSDEQFAEWFRFIPYGGDGETMGEKSLAIFEVRSEEAFIGHGYAYRVVMRHVLETHVLDEVYLPSYSKYTADLLWADENFGETAQYIVDLRQAFAKTACGSDKCPTDCGICSGFVSDRYAFPYKERLDLDDEDNWWWLYGSRYRNPKPLTQPLRFSFPRSLRGANCTR